MYEIYKILGSLLVPPGLLLLIIIWATILVYRNRRKAMRQVMILAMLLMYSLSIAPVAEGLLLPLEDWYPPFGLTKSNPKVSTIKDVEYIMVLGGGTIENSPEYDGASVLAEEPLKRLDYALDLQQRLGLPIIVSGGRPVRNKNGLSEGEVFKAYCLKRGIASANIFVESKSRNTDENMIETKTLYNPKKIILVTSAYHMPRSVFIASEHGIDSIPAPTAFKVSRVGYTWQSFLPDKYAMYQSSVAIKEYIGLLFYLLKSMF